MTLNKERIPEYTDLFVLYRNKKIEKKIHNKVLKDIVKMKRWILTGLSVLLIGWYFGAHNYIQQNLILVGTAFTSLSFAHKNDPGQSGFTVIPSHQIKNPGSEKILTLADALSSVSQECISAVKKPFIETPFLDVFSWIERIYKYIGWEYNPQQYTGHDLNDMSICEQGDPKEKYTYSFDLPMIGNVVITVEDSITTSFIVNHDPLLFSIRNQDGTVVNEFIYDMKWNQPSTFSFGGIKCDSVVLFSINSSMYKSLAIMNTTIHDMAISCQFNPFQNASKMLSEFSIKLGHMDYELSAKNIVEKHILNILTWYHMENLKSAIESYIQGKITDAWGNTTMTITKSINGWFDYSKSLIYSILPSFTKND